MKKIANYFKIGTLLIGLLFFTNCEKEELLDNYLEGTTKNDVKYTVPNIAIAKDNFQKTTNFQNPLKSSNTLDNSENFIDWDNSENLIFKENINILYTPIKYNKKNKRTKSFVASVTNDNNSIESFIFSIFYANDSTPEIFSGYISKFDTNGNAIEIYEYKKGQLETTYTFKKNKKTNNNNKNYLSKRARRGGDCGDCDDCGITREELNLLFDTIEDDEPINMLDCVEVKASPKRDDSIDTSRDNNVRATYFDVNPWPSVPSYWNSPPKETSGYHRSGVHLKPRNNTLKWLEEEKINAQIRAQAARDQRIRIFFAVLKLTPEEKEFLLKKENADILAELILFINFNDEKQIALAKQIVEILANLNLTYQEELTVNAKVNEIFNIISSNNFKDINLYSLDDQNTIIQNSLFISFLPNLKDLGIQLPQTAKEWKEFGEILVEIMYEIIPDLIPGVSELNSLKNAISAFNNGSYTDGTTELAFALVGVFPAGKVLKAGAKFGKLIKKSTKIFKVYLKLFKLNKPLARGYKRVIKNSHDMSHIFGNTGHKLSALITKVRGEKEALLAAVNRVQELGLYASVPNGQFKRFTNVNVLGELLTIDVFKNLDGNVTHISNMFKP